MKNSRLLLLSVIFPLFLYVSHPVIAGDQKKAQKKKENKEDNTKTSETDHSVEIQDETVEYRATAGKLPLKKRDDKTLAEIFYISYEKKGTSDEKDRPILFSFNGGPGSSSVWLHLGLLGPRFIDFPDGTRNPEPPYTLTDNAQSLLDKFDLVFIDPVSTGYSRSGKDVDEKRFHGVKQDIQSVGKFIYQYLDRNERWNSPKFVIGESYGTTRAAGLSKYLKKRHGIDLNGIMLVSPILDFDRRKTVLSTILRFPTYVASAYYHDQLSDELLDMSLEELLTEVEQFCFQEYAPALHLGDRMSEERRNRIRQKISKYTGLSESFIETNNLRISLGRFSKQLLRGQSRILGRFDSRYTGFSQDPGNDRYGYDPSYTTLQGPFSETMYQYLRTELNYESDDYYEIIGNVRPWDYGSHGGRRSVNLVPDLREAMLSNPHMNVFVAGGYYDLATPYYAAEYTFHHLNLPEELRKNLTMEYYRAGHMMYVHDPSRAKLRDDLVKFLENSISDE